jgi:hypothetical protein
MEWPRIVKIKLTQRYSTYLPGTVVECEDETAQRLIHEGIAIRDQPEVERASLEPEVERADIRPRRRRSAVSEPDTTDAPGG